MKRGFTLIEMLVAGSLLGMLMTILTMIFNQSSISWRTGNALVADLDDLSCDIAKVRNEADNIYPWNGKNLVLLSLFDKNGKLRTGARAIGGSGAASLEQGESPVKIPALSESADADDISASVSLSSGDSGQSSADYTVNVMSAGPNLKFDDYDDIWSFPDEFD